MAVEPEQVDAQKHHVNRRYFSQVASGTRQYRDVSSFVEKRIKRFPGRGLQNSGRERGNRLGCPSIVYRPRLPEMRAF